MKNMQRRKQIPDLSPFAEIVHKKGNIIDQNIELLSYIDESRLTVLFYN
jgi:hypothetical protein